MTPFLPKGTLTSSFKKSIDAYLAVTVPEGKTGAVLAVLTPAGMQFGAAVRFGDSWKLEAGVERAWSGDVGQVVVMGSW